MNQQDWDRIRAELKAGLPQHRLDPASTSLRSAGDGEMVLKHIAEALRDENGMLKVDADWSLKQATANR